MDLVHLSYLEVIYSFRIQIQNVTTLYLHDHFITTLHTCTLAANALPGMLLAIKALFKPPFWRTSKKCKSRYENTYK